MQSGRTRLRVQQYLEAYVALAQRNSKPANSYTIHPLPATRKREDVGVGSALTMLEPRLLAGVATALLGAFNNGYVLCVIAGAIPQLTAQFSLTASASSLVVSVLMLGALLGSLCGSFVCDVLGRRPCLVLCGLAYASSPPLRHRLVGRDDRLRAPARPLGLAGVATIYLTEVAPPDCAARW